jgi:hypothetical protein
MIIGLLLRHLPYRIEGDGHFIAGFGFKMHERLLIFAFYVKAIEQIGITILSISILGSILLVLGRHRLEEIVLEVAGVTVEVELVLDFLPEHLDVLGRGERL